MKKTTDPVIKAKRIYTIELLVFAVVFLTLGILIMFHVIPLSERYRYIFSWLTVFGGAWLVTDFFWALLSKKRQKRVALIDKISTLPAGLFLITFDLIALINGPMNMAYEYYQYGCSGVFIYIALVYTFQGIYHWYHPIPGFIEGILEDEKNKEVL